MGWTKHEPHSKDCGLKEKHPKFRTFRSHTECKFEHNLDAYKTGKGKRNPELTEIPLLYVSEV
jgi:hypothetical protein